MSTALLHEMGEALFGAQWQCGLARELAVSDRTVRRWAAGTHAPPPRVWADIARIAFARRAELSRLLPLAAARSEGLAALAQDAPAAGCL